jgi:hypothetical protein
VVKRKRRIDYLFEEILGFTTYSEQTDFLKKNNWKLVVIEKDGCIQDVRNLHSYNKRVAWLSVTTTTEQDFVLDDIEFST